MTDQEIIQEVSADYCDIINKSIDRLISDYIRKRRRNKVNKTASCPIIFEIKTQRKNKWLIVIQKSGYSNKFDGSTESFMCTHYYGPKGLRVFPAQFVNHGSFFNQNSYVDVSAFNGHLFTRYNQRLNLGITNSYDIVKQYFTKNSMFYAELVEKNNRHFSLTVCKEGILLGEKTPDWIIQKTFITREITKEDQEQTERELLDGLQKQIDGLLMEPDIFYLGPDRLKSLLKNISE